MTNTRQREVRTRRIDLQLVIGRLKVVGDISVFLAWDARGLDWFD